MATAQVTPPNIPTTVTSEENVTPEAGTTAESTNKRKGPPQKVNWPGLEFVGEKVKKLKAIPGLLSADNSDGFNPVKHKQLTAANFVEPHLVESHKATVYRWRADECDKAAKDILKNGVGGNKQAKAITSALSKIKDMKGDLNAAEFKDMYPEVAALLDGLV